MNKNFTLNDLNLLNEMPEERNNTNKFQKALPSEQVMQNILSFAKVLNVIKTHSTGNMKLILN